ncbi:MAG TPA: acyl carrier protein [Woeseiaceae bacterium]
MADPIDRIIAAARNQLNAEIGPDTDLTELGDALDLAAIEMAVEENSGIAIPDGFLADHPTPRLAAEAMKEMV